MFYRSNKNTWVTKAIFLEYLVFLNKLIISQNRKILLLIDNAPGHKVNSLSNIKLIELPPNTTATLQPLDQGIIKSFKNYYKNYLNNFLFSKLVSEDLNIKTAFVKLSLIDVLYWILESLNLVSEKTVKNCWAIFDKMKAEDFDIGKKTEPENTDNEITSKLKELSILFEENEVEIKTRFLTTMIIIFYTKPLFLHIFV